MDYLGIPRCKTMPLLTTFKSDTLPAAAVYAGHGAATPCCYGGRHVLLCPADKNQHRLEEAHAVFQEVQNAYEVLSDKHERAW